MSTDFAKKMYADIKSEREKFKDIEVEVEEEFRFRVTNKVYPKMCYDKSFDYIISHMNLEIKLVHGTIDFIIGDNQILKIPHGWIEFENVLFDGVYQKFYDKEKMIKRRGYLKEVEYTCREACDKGIETGYKGAWSYGKQDTELSDMFKALWASEALKE